MNDLFATVEDWSEGSITRCGVWYKLVVGLLFVAGLSLIVGDTSDMFAGAS